MWVLGGVDARLDVNDLFFVACDTPSHTNLVWHSLDMFSASGYPRCGASTSTISDSNISRDSRSVWHTERGAVTCSIQETLFPASRLGVLCKYAQLLAPIGI